MNVYVYMSSNPPTNGHHNGQAAAPLNPVSTVDTGHDERGRFTKGNTAAAGNPTHCKMARLRCSLLRALDEDKMQTLAERLNQRDLDGDIAAATLLLRYALGVPRECPDPDSMDLDEWQRLKSRPSKQAVFVALTDVVPVDEAVDAMRRFFALPRSKLLDPEKLNVSEDDLIAERDERRRWQRKGRR